MTSIAVINVAVYKTVPIYGLVNRLGESKTQSQVTSTNHHPIHCSLLIANFGIYTDYYLESVYKCPINQNRHSGESRNPVLSRPSGCRIKPGMTERPVYGQTLFCDSYPVRKSLDVSIGFDFAVEYVFASLLILLAGVADGATNPFKILHALQGIYESLII